MRRLPFLLVGIVAPGALLAQMPASFEVASVRRNEAGPGSSLPFLQIRPGGVFTATNQPVVRLVAFAHRVEDYRVVGGRGWIRETRFDVNARAGSEVPDQQIRLMLQSLLRDRFGLVTHTERREMPLYTLVLAREDGRLGPGVQPVENCNAGPPRGGGPNTFHGCGAISAAASIASMMLGAPVVDKSGVRGTFNVSLTFSPEGVRPFPGDTFTPATDPDLPSLRDALREQLGLRLESGRGPVDVLVIDSVRQPTEN